MRISDWSSNVCSSDLVSNVSLQVMPRETLAIIGPNGAGKTTFYSMLSGRMQPTDGSILFQGQNITGLPAHRISRMGISRSFQINNIFSEMTVRENVEVALTAYHGDSRRWINIASRNTPIQREAGALLERLPLPELAAIRAGVGRRVVWGTGLPVRVEPGGLR